MECISILPVINEKHEIFFKFLNIGLILTEVDFDSEELMSLGSYVIILEFIAVFVSRLPSGFLKVNIRCFKMLFLFNVIYHSYLSFLKIECISFSI